MQQLTTLIQKRLNQHKLGDTAKAAQILHVTGILLTELKIDSHHVKPLSLKDGRLIIGVTSSVWAQEVWACREELMEKIKKVCKEQAVVKIVIKAVSHKTVMAND